MKKLAVVVGFGGINSAGRSSGFHAYKRLLLDHLPASEQRSTYASLAQLMGLNPQTQQHEIKAGTLIRQLEKPIAQVQSAGLLPKGFTVGDGYPSHHHPRGLQMSVYAMSDALGQLGVNFDCLKQQVSPTQISVYAGSAMGQLDDLGFGGMLKANALGKRASAKQCALGFNQMPADFINAYLLGNLGTTGNLSGACATFLYNLKLAVDDIQLGRSRIAIVGTSEAPITPEIIEGYSAMTALTSEPKLRALDNLTAEQAIDFARASRPFAENVGFTLAESAQFFILSDDQLALDNGLTIYASVREVFIQADGFKRSISNPGVGNYISLAKAMASAQRQFGKEALQQGSYVHAHGSSTPANRTSESHILSTLAQTFEIPAWPVTAVKSYWGHSLASASADQLLCALGSWRYGIIPGIKSIHCLAEDVHQHHLQFLLDHKELDSQQQALCFLNAKGFGGNNASAYLIGPSQSMALLKGKYSQTEWKSYQHKNESVMQQAADFDLACSAGNTKPSYHFGEQVLSAADLVISQNSIEIAGWPLKIEL
ncbi:MAG: beta-ketoacyl synthase [Venatoribacter sp.]